MTENASGLIDAGRLVLAFAKVNRATFHEDGSTPESDTDHTIMLSVCACALARKLYLDVLDVGLVAQFAIVHDLVEAYASDTDSFGITEEGRKEKEKREQMAQMRIEEEFRGVYPWIPEMIARYEALDTKEARFVKTVDKIMNKITHVLNHGAYFKKHGMDKEKMWSMYELTRVAEERHAAEFPELVALNEELILEARRLSFDIE